MRVIDISQEVLSCSVYEGDPTPKTDRIMDIKKGEIYNLSTISMCAHNGTHIDAPLHFFSNGLAVHEIPIENFVGECFVAEANGNLFATDTREILEKAKRVSAEKRILIKGNATVTEEAAKAFANAGILLLGVEGQSVGPIDAPMRVHKILLSKNIILLEGTVLEKAREGRYILNCAPLNIEGIEGSPCRAILIEE